MLIAAFLYGKTKHNLYTYTVPGLGALCSNCGLFSEYKFLMNFLHKLLDGFRKAMLLKINRDIFAENRVPNWT